MNARLDNIEEAIVYLAKELGDDSHAAYDHKKRVLEILGLTEKV